MASEQGNGGHPTDAAHEPRECMPCRGSGQVISSLGGTATSVPCPWCEGTGTRVPGIDAQARWRGDGNAGAAGGEASPSAEAAAGGEEPIG